MVEIPDTSTFGVSQGKVELSLTLILVPTGSLDPYNTSSLFFENTVFHFQDKLPALTFSLTCFLYCYPVKVETAFSHRRRSVYQKPPQSFLIFFLKKKVVLSGVGFPFFQDFPQSFYLRRGKGFCRFCYLYIILYAVFHNYSSPFFLPVLDGLYAQEVAGMSNLGCGSA